MIRKFIFCCFCLCASNVSATDKILSEDRETGQSLSLVEKSLVKEASLLRESEYRSPLIRGTKAEEEASSELSTMLDAGKIPDSIYSLAVIGKHSSVSLLARLNYQSESKGKPFLENKKKGTNRFDLIADPLLAEIMSYTDVINTAEISQRFFNVLRSPQLGLIAFHNIKKWYVLSNEINQFLASSWQRFNVLVFEVYADLPGVSSHHLKKLVKHHKEIRSLELKDCKNLTDISALEGLTYLHTLTLVRVPIKNISALVRIPSLHTLKLIETSVTKVSTLARAPRLHTLTIIGPSITDMQALDRDAPHIKVNFE